jgi:hypothetical protein
MNGLKLLLISSIALCGMHVVGVAVGKFGLASVHIFLQTMGVLLRDDAD